MTFSIWAWRKTALVADAIVPREIESLQPSLHSIIDRVKGRTKEPNNGCEGLLKTWDIKTICEAPGLIKDSIFIATRYIGLIETRDKEDDGWVNPWKCKRCPES